MVRFLKFLIAFIFIGYISDNKPCFTCDIVQKNLFEHKDQKEICIGILPLGNFDNGKLLLVKSNRDLS